MKGLLSLSIPVEKINTELFAVDKNGKKYLNITIAVGDTDNYGNQVSAWHQQTKEQREAKEKRTYVGNGKILSTDAAQAPQAQKAKEQNGWN